MLTVQNLLNTGVAYEASGNVYFEIKTWDDFGNLSGLTYDEMLPIANERGNFPDDLLKRDPLDFVLWQAQVGDEPAWPSPWGLGRPGWHIECSTMAAKYLGKTIDIHSGGADLEFPHHECEIVQAEAVMGDRPFSRFWMHAAMVHHEGEKMSKSLGNLVMIRDLLQSWSTDALRLYLGSYNYRQTWSHDEIRLAEMARLADRISAALRVEVLPAAPAIENEYLKRFERALDDDLNSPDAITVIRELTDLILEEAQKGGVPDGLPAALAKMGRVLGLQLDDGKPEARVAEVWSRHLDRFKN